MFLVLLFLLLFVTCFHCLLLFSVPSSSCYLFSTVDGLGSLRLLMFKDLSYFVTWTWPHCSLQPVIFWFGFRPNSILCLKGCQAFLLRARTLRWYWPCIIGHVHQCPQKLPDLKGSLNTQVQFLCQNQHKLNMTISVWCGRIISMYKLFYLRVIVEKHLLPFSLLQFSLFKIFYILIFLNHHFELVLLCRSTQRTEMFTIKNPQVL